MKLGGKNKENNFLQRVNTTSFQESKASGKGLFKIY